MASGEESVFTPSSAHINGIFQYELTNAFLNLLDERGSDFLYNLIERANSYTNHMRDIYLNGLNSIKDWGKEVINQEILQMKNDYPNIEKIYASVIQIYLIEFFKNMTNQTTQNLLVPSLGTFLKEFYVKLANNEDIRSFAFFGFNTMQKKEIFAYIMRKTLQAILTEPISLLLKEVETPSSTYMNVSTTTSFKSKSQKPESHRPESHRPESHRPESHRPESHRPESHRPESHKPESQTSNPSSSVFNKYVDSVIQGMESPKENVNHDLREERKPRKMESSRTSSVKTPNSSINIMMPSRTNQIPRHHVPSKKSSSSREIPKAPNTTNSYFTLPYDVSKEALKSSHKKHLSSSSKPGDRQVDRQVGRQVKEFVKEASSVKKMELRTPSSSVRRKEKRKDEKSLNSSSSSGDDGDYSSENDSE